MDMEMADFIHRLTGHFIELGGLSVLPPHLLPQRLHMSVSGKGSPEKRGGGQELGVVARSVRSFLHHRARQSSRANKGTRTGSGTGVVGLGLGSFLASPLLNSSSELTSQDSSSSDIDKTDDIMSAFELVESPLQLMKRAGLDLISTGWGRSAP